MPIHDWTRVDAGLFHHFHHAWIEEFSRALNRDVLPSEYFALSEQHISGPIPDVLTLQLGKANGDADERGGAAPELSNHASPIAVAERPPQTRLTSRAEVELYARKASRIVVRHRHGRVVAVIEIVSPGNKASQAEFRSFVNKSVDLIRQGVHLLVIDLFPPGKRDPQGVHKVIWDVEEDFELPTDQRLTLAGYDAGEYVAYVEFLAVGDELPQMPLFLTPGEYVEAPLETTYGSAWEVFPSPLKGLLL